MSDEIKSVLRMITCDWVPDTSAIIDDDRYLYGWDVLHVHEIDSGGLTKVGYRYIGSANITGPHTGKLYTDLPVKKGQQFRWCFGIAEVVSVAKNQDQRRGAR